MSGHSGGEVPISVCLALALLLWLVVAQLCKALLCHGKDTQRCSSSVSKWEGLISLDMACLFFRSSHYLLQVILKLKDCGSCIIRNRTASG